MARTIAQIKEEILLAKAGESALSSVNSDSKVAEWNLWVDIVAFCTYTLEQLFDFFKADVDAKLATMKPHTLQWYVTKAKAFQLGEDLPPDTDVYPEVPPSDSSVLIIKSAAAEEFFGLNLVRIKVAKQGVSGLAPLDDPDELDPFSSYMFRIKDAGVRLQIISSAPDNLKLALEVYYDPLILDATGARLDGADTQPVKKAINTFLASLPFNGVFIINELINALENTEGVEIAHIVNAETNYALTSYVPVDVKYTPNAGYMVLNNTYFDANVVYIPYSSEVG